MIEVSSLPDQRRPNKPFSLLILLIIAGILLYLLSLKIALWPAGAAVSTGWLLATSASKNRFRTVVVSAIIGSLLGCLVETMYSRQSVMERTYEHIVWSNAIAYAFGAIAGASVGLFRLLKQQTP